MLPQPNPHQFEFSLLENGLDFVLSGLEHLTAASSGQNLTTKRHLKYAVLHLSSGIELVFKERLRQEHWSLLFHDVNKASKQQYDLGDFISVTSAEAQDRLTGVCGIKLPQKQQTDLNNFRKRRNKLEHFGAVDSLPAVMASVSSMVSLLIDFVEFAFTTESLSEEEVLLSAIRTEMGNCQAFVSQRWKELKSLLPNGESLVACPTCQQRALVFGDEEIKCRFCNVGCDSKTAATEYIENVLGYSYYDHVKDGGPWPLDRCPNCYCEALVSSVPVANDETVRFCFNCQEEWKRGSLVRCSDCNELYQSDDPEEDIGVCSECWAYKVAKD
jgi:hypothetical protein